MLNTPDPLQRRLIAGAVAPILLLVLTGVLFLSLRTPGGGMTPLGLIAPLDLLAVAVSMAVGGLLAREGFRGWAVVLVLLAGITSAIAAYGFAPPGQSGAARSLLRNTGMQLLLSAAIAWTAAYAGERIAARRLRTPQGSE